MALKRQTLPMVVGLIVAALVGLITLQVYLLQNAFELKEQAFERNVWSALISASLQLETGETMARVLQATAAGPKGSDYLTKTPRNVNVRVEGDALRYHVATPQRVRVQISDAFGRDSVLVDSLKPAGDHAFAFASGKGDFVYRFRTDSSTFVVNVSDGVPGRVLSSPRTEKERAVLLTRVIDNLWVTEGEPLEKRYKPSAVDSVLKRTMQEAGIPLEFAYGVLVAKHDSAGADTVKMVTPVGSTQDLLASEFRTPLSPLIPGGRHERLVVSFPGRRLFLLQQIWPSLIASVVFLTVIVGTFVYTIRTIMNQRRLAGQMVDFVNTMTHEFKTPISTIALASEAIQRPDVLRRKPKVLQYNQMIAEETSRMRGQVDRILQMAQLEEGEIELTLSAVDVHELIASAARTFALQVERRGGHIVQDLRAVSHVVQGDAVHLRNILHGLLDNANKYSPEAPDITIATFNDGRWLSVQIADKGIGIEVEHHKKVFEKYYRVPSGNLHDVKGFGLGLSYVRLLVGIHHGAVTLQSNPGQGTVVTLRLPTA